MVVKTILPTPAPGYAKTPRKNGVRMHLVLPLATNAIDGSQNRTSTEALENIRHGKSIDKNGSSLGPPGLRK
jgi:hypothetical protein